ncbi:hypothetical protein AB0G04_20495 [Actinoplanes sp. NPDC023801]|uniref:ATP-dependent DNA ligase n=1 Tax=Actinoplanes sp. NPDC023801 TaxID=3154595 RepID=UPI0033ED0587
MPTRAANALIDTIRGRLPPDCRCLTRHRESGERRLEMPRIRRSSRIYLLSRQLKDLTHPASYIVYDLLEFDGHELLDRPLLERRLLREELLAGNPPGLTLCPATRDPDEARDWFDTYHAAGCEGLAIKDLTSKYGATLAGWWKWKRRTVTKIGGSGCCVPPSGFIEPGPATWSSGNWVDRRLCRRIWNGHGRPRGGHPSVHLRVQRAGRPVRQGSCKGSPSCRAGPGPPGRRPAGRSRRSRRW